MQKNWMPNSKFDEITAAVPLWSEKFIDSNKRKAGKEMER